MGKTKKVNYEIHMTFDGEIIFTEDNTGYKNIDDGPIEALNNLATEIDNEEECQRCLKV